MIQLLVLVAAGMMFCCRCTERQRNESISSEEGVVDPDRLPDGVYSPAESHSIYADAGTQR